MIASDDTIRDIWEIEQRGKRYRPWYARNIWVYTDDWEESRLLQSIFYRQRLRTHIQWLKKKKKEYEKEHWLWCKIILPLTKPLDTWLYNLRISLIGR